MSDHVVDFWSTPWLYKFPFSIDDDGTVWARCVDDTSDNWAPSDYGWEPVQHGPLPAPVPASLPDTCF